MRARSTPSAARGRSRCWPTGTSTRASRSRIGRDPTGPASARSSARAPNRCWPRSRRAVPPPPTTICARTWWCCHRWPRRASSSTTCWSTTLTGSRPSTGSRRSTWLSPAPPAPSQSRSGGASSVISDPPGSGAGWHEGRCAGAGDRCDPRAWSLWPTIPAARWPTIPDQRGAPVTLPRSVVTIRGRSVTAVGEAQQAPRAGKKSSFRPDVQGLRAIAVRLVVLYHAGLQTLSGGFVGVDVFFVISGFLITTHLLESLQTHGRIPFASFYAKRARRILPASLLVAGLTVVAAWLWMPPLLMTQVFEGAVATALYVPNILFAVEGTEYLAETSPSVFQHYWSLGIEEQFYLFWPAILAAGFWLARRSERRLLYGVAALTLVSFIACVVWMDISQSWTFFSLPTRAWELGVGGLLAFLMRMGGQWLLRSGVW